MGDTSNKDAEAKPFIEAFFNILGISRKRVVKFEQRVKKLSEANGYIDILWKGGNSYRNEKQRPKP